MNISNLLKPILNPYKSSKLSYYIFLAKAVLNDIMNILLELLFAKEMIFIHQRK